MYEQIVWRRLEVIKKSPDCWNSGSCRVCGCDIIGKTMEDRACSKSEHTDLGEPCYPAMMTEEEWKEFKIKNNITIFEL